MEWEQEGWDEEEGMGGICEIRWELWDPVG